MREHTSPHPGSGDDAECSGKLPATCMDQHLLLGAVLSICCCMGRHICIRSRRRQDMAHACLTHAKASVIHHGPWWLSQIIPDRYGLEHPLPRHSNWCKCQIATLDVIQPRCLLPERPGRSFASWERSTSLARGRFAAWTCTPSPRWCISSRTCPIGPRHRGLIPINVKAVIARDEWTVRHLLCMQHGRKSRLC